MNQFDYSQTFVRARELQAQLAQDHSGERMRQLVRYFADAEDAALQISTEQSDSTETKEVLNAMILAFGRCRSIVEAVWQGLHAQVADYGLEAS